MPEDKSPKYHDRRSFIKNGLNTTAALALGGIAGFTITRSTKGDMVWQIDPDKCIQCEKCAINCVLYPSAVKCVHAYAMCGYCKLCGGYHQPGTKRLDTAAESQLCPTNAIKRTFVENPYFEYTIDEKLCIGCAKCVKGCGSFGNGSLFLQVRHDICVNCNECNIALNCPADAWVRVPADNPYLFRGEVRESPTATSESGDV
ncbi:ferredoxin [candidate division KSB1 bacterium]|nr:ferredoxin [candidate division KSB1 bacterium]